MPLRATLVQSLLLLARPFRAGGRAIAALWRRVGRVDWVGVIGTLVAAGAWLALLVGLGVVAYQLYMRLVWSYWVMLPLADVAEAVDVYLPLPDSLLNVPVALYLVPPAIVVLFLHGEWSAARYRRRGEGRKPLPTRKRRSPAARRGPFRLPSFRRKRDPS